MLTKRERDKAYAKKKRAQYRRLNSLARKGVPGAKERRDTLDEKLKIVGIRTNAWEPLKNSLFKDLDQKSEAVGKVNKV
ncbi:hypothetical protein [Noviherbaspirillum malthae]|uniref:hypothetical protein n=1 Tax=Noviherbaspirillum malthae TaxID=1260987 RepID=UPI0018905466|nr:hypothetical protein [Noviherbaspirillum malthae]